MPRLQLDLSAAALGEGQFAARTDHAEAQLVIGAAAFGEGQSAAVTDTQPGLLWFGQQLEKLRQLA